MRQPLAINHYLVMGAESRVKSAVFPIPNENFTLAIARNQIRLIGGEARTAGITSDDMTLELFFLLWPKLAICAVKNANLKKSSNFMMRVSEKVKNLVVKRSGGQVLFIGRLANSWH